MKTTTYPGIDYSGPGATCNRDSQTGIRYGIISNSSVCPEANDDMEPDYGEPTCPKCGNRAEEIQDIPEIMQDFECARGEASDYACVDCEYLFGSESAFGDPIGYYLDSDEEKVILNKSGDLWVIKSPYYTYAQFCSPCAPGACYLGTPVASDFTSNKCYCLGPDWFEDGKAPYRMWSVETGEEVGVPMPNSTQG